MLLKNTKKLRLMGS